MITIWSKWNIRGQEDKVKNMSTRTDVLLKSIKLRPEDKHVAQSDCIQPKGLSERIQKRGTKVQVVNALWKMGSRNYSMTSITVGIPIIPPGLTVRVGKGSVWTTLHPQSPRVTYRCMSTVDLQNRNDLSIWDVFKRNTCRPTGANVS